MTREEIKQTIEDFLALIQSSDSVEEREKKLKFVLDKLALAHHFADRAIDETNYPDALCEDYNKLREIISVKFPNYGFYNQAHFVSRDIGVISENTLGDAIDDITDIAIDLAETLYYWENTSIDDALWHFKFSFETHWERHLRGLQFYLCALKDGR